MSDHSADDSELSQRLLKLIAGALDAIEARAGITRNVGDRSKSLFFPAGVGEIAVSLTSAGESASLVVGSKSVSPETPGRPLGSAHPMDVDPLWSATAGSTYTIDVFETKMSGVRTQIGTTQVIHPNMPQRINLD